jgi:hypothetical protein
MRACNYSPCSTLEGMRRFWVYRRHDRPPLPILTPLLRIDVLWSDLHMVPEGRSLMSCDSFYGTFRTA